MGLEEFFGLDQSEGTDAASFEKFKERMRRAAAQIKAIKKEEKKRKKKESELVKILLKFIQTSRKKDLVLVISRALEQNLPANFILAVVILGNEDIQREVGEYLMLKTSDGSPTSEAPAQADQEKAVTFFGEDQTLPLKVKIEIDRWIKNLMHQASESPQKLLMYAYDVVEVAIDDSDDDSDDDDDSPFSEPFSSQFDHQKTKKEKIISPKLTQLIAHVIFDFLKQNDIEEDFVRLKEFAEFLAKGILTKTQEDLQTRKELGGGEIDSDA